MSHPIAKWTVGFVILILIVLIGSMFLDAPFKKYILYKINNRIEGYRVEAADLDFNPFNLGILIDNLKIIQLKHPDPPVVNMETIYLHLHWRELLTGDLVAVCEMQNPELHFNLPQLREEKRLKRKKSWQQTLKELYPLEINRLEIRDGQAVYIAGKEASPIRISSIEARVNNIRNVDNPEKAFPSSFDVKAVLFEKGGRIEVSGRGDFLREPHMGIEASYKISEMPLNQLKPVAQRFGALVTSGSFNSTGEFTYSPEKRELIAKNLAIQQLKVDYVLARTLPDKDQSPPEQKKMPFHYFIEKLHVTGMAGFVNKTTDPQYRIFLGDLNLKATNLSDRFRKGGAEVNLEGYFMGNGNTLITGNFQETDTRPDFDLRIRVIGTRLESLNDLFRAYANLDVAEGSLTLYSEIDVANGKIDGFIKPFISEIDIYEDDQDSRQGLLQKLYEGFMDTMAEVLENDPRDMATKANLSGSLDNPDSDTLEILLYLVENAFFDAILPGFETQAERNR